MASMQQTGLIHWPGGPQVDVDLMASIEAHNAQAEAEWEALRVRRGWTVERLAAYRAEVDHISDDWAEASEAEASGR